jgi:hypothetical protein
LGRKLINLSLDDYRRRFEGGDDRALVEAVDVIVRLFAPEWVRDNWIERIEACHTHDNRTFDECLKIERKEWTHSRDQRKREKWRARLVWGIAALERKLGSRTLAIQAIAKENEVAFSWVEGILYEDASRPWRRLFGVQVRERQRR